MQFCLTEASNHNFKFVLKYALGKTHSEVFDIFETTIER